MEAIGNRRQNGKIIQRETINLLEIALYLKLLVNLSTYSFGKSRTKSLRYGINTHLYHFVARAKLEHRKETVEKRSLSCSLKLVQNEESFISSLVGSLLLS